jgi:hypothetical protein
MSRSKKPKPKNTMPSTTLAPLSSRKRRKKIQARVSAAVSMPEPLYLASLKQAEAKAGNNWSSYVRNLIHADLRSA